MLGSQDTKRNETTRYAFRPGLPLKALYLLSKRLCAGPMEWLLQGER